jgi:hypothetical protein
MTDNCIDPSQWGCDELKDDCFLLFIVGEDTEDPKIGWYYGPAGRVGFATNG